MINSDAINMMKVLPQTSHCLRRKVGAVLVKDGNIITVGVNAPGRGIKPCETCPRESLPSGEKLNECLATHAEQRCIAAAAYAELSTAGATMFVTHRPCSMCMKLIIAAGIKEVYFNYDYPDPLTCTLAEAAGVKLVKTGGED